MEPPSFINFHVLELDFPVMTLAQTEWTEVSPMFNTNKGATTAGPVRGPFFSEGIMAPKSWQVGVSMGDPQ